MIQWSEEFGETASGERDRHKATLSQLAMESNTNSGHYDAMTVLFVLLSFGVFLIITAYLTRLVARDGHGSNPIPRSHREELGGRVEQELGR
jgi:hypothetical protein